MSLLDSFTAPKWQHKNPEIRTKAVADIDDEQILLTLVREDPDLAVQSAALARITQPETLDRLIDETAGPLLQQARKQRLGQLLPDPSELAKIRDAAALRKIALLSEEPELIARAIGAIADREMLIELASEHPLAAARLEAAQSLADIPSLNTLMQKARGHDKSVYRHCKSVLDAHHAREREAQKREQEIRQLGDRIERLAEAPIAPTFRAEYLQLTERWARLAGQAAAGQAQRFEAAANRCAERVAQAEQERSAKEALQRRQAEAEQALAGIAADLDAIEMVMPDEAGALTELAHRLDVLEARQAEAEQTASMPAAQQKALQAKIAGWRTAIETSRALRSRQAQWKKMLEKAAHLDSADYSAIRQQADRTADLLESLPWPAALSLPEPEPLQKLRETHEQLEKRISRLEEQREKHVGQLQASLESLRSELDQEHLKAAARSLNRARQVLKKLPPAEQQRFEHDFRPLAARLHEFQDWQDFAIEPKKLELVERMQALIGSGQDSDTLAATIKTLQAEWKALGGLPHAREQELWNEFKAASDEAWKPCKAAFEERDRQQQENFEQRMRLVAQLDEYEKNMAWPDVAADEASDTAGTSAPPDWRLVQKTLDTARQAFAEIKPVKPKAARKSQKALNKVCERIYSHVKAEYDRNIALKEQLAAEARALTDNDDLQQAIEKAKRLQADWKQVGITPVSVDRKLWKAFRGACDAVFKQLDEQRQHTHAAMDEQIKAAESLRDQARELLGMDSIEAGSKLGRQLAELKDAFRRIELPRAVQQKLSREFQDMEKKARDIARDLRQQRERQSWALLADKIRACALKAADTAKAESLWQQAGGLPKGVDAAALDSFWQQGPAIEAGAEAEERLRTACIALEVLGEIESPAADKQARMNYQMQRLAEGMGGGVPDPEQALLDQINAFVALRPSDQWAERFCSTLSALR